ncbi:tetratricopeptide repeat protein [Pseudomonas sp. MWU12-2345]|uniref:tetratricopeptide repeat protein n=1 Tax=Pseudomonas sp. MWU12-2345 TaxID=2928689 RepID=UPI00200E4353|nr:tetratricopeptide repeat protein [Pseudomonas sp. MWU12-2345]
MDQDTSNQGVERDRLRLEDTKFRSESSHNRTVLWVGAFVSVVVVIIPATSSYLNESARLKLDAHRQEVELQQKADDLKLKQSEMERSRDATRVKFLQDHIDMIMSDEPDAELRLTALARLVLPVDADALIAQVHTIRRELALQRSSAQKTDGVSMAQQDTAEEDSSVPPLVVTPRAVSASGDQQLAPGMAEGRAYVRKGDFESALRNFNTAIEQNPNDPLAWNFKAYSEFRTNQFTAALASISRAWKLNPSENRTRRFIAINATKILCAQGRSSEAATFFNQSASVVPEIVTDVYADGEFQSTCKAIWRG